MKHNWGYKPFAEICITLTPTSKIGKSEYLSHGQYPIISQEDIYISGYWNDKKDITLHSSPVIIFGDHSRVLKYVDFEFVVGADGVKIIQPIGLLDAKFLYHFLRWYNVPSLGYSRHFKLLKEANYPVPPMETQKQIVAELDQINDLIAKNRELLSQLDALAQSLFYDTFGDPISNPKGWNTSRIEDCCSHLYAGGDKPKYTTTERTAENQIPIYSNGVDNKGLYGYTSVPRSTEPSITISGRGTIGVPFIRKNPFFPIIRLIVATPNPSIIDIQYLYFTFLSLNLGGKGAAIPQLTVPMVKDINIPIPPLALQEDFAAKVETIESQKAKVEAEIAELQTLLNARMDYWFN